MKPDLANLVEADLAKRWNEPRSDVLRELYNEDREDFRKKDARFTMWAAVVIYILFAVPDFLLIPDVAPYTAVARLIFGLLALGSVEGLIRINATADLIDKVSAGAAVVCYSVWLGLSVLSEHTLSVSYYMVFGTIFMMVVSLFFNFRPIPSLVAPLLILTTFFYVMLFVIPVPESYKFAFGTFYVSCFAFTTYMNWKLNSERYHVFLNALQAQIRQEEVVERGNALLKLSRTDPLTGLDNRRAVDGKLRDYWNDWQRFGSSFVVMLIDVDFFKKFNDCYGHQEGDRCLVLVANALSETMKEYNGSIGRYGGEEFIVLARMENKEQVLAFAEAIRRTVENLAILHEQRRDGMTTVTVSIGAAETRNQTGAKLEKIIHEADRALYLAKASGRNCSKLFDPNDPQSSDESENIAALLKIAISQKLVSLVYQPIQNVASGRVEAVEALMRLRMLDGTSVPPSLFIPVAERTGAILDLGRWAIRTVCTELLMDNHARVVSVNVSPIQLKTPGFATSVAAILGEMGVTGDRLAFEITEGLEMEMHSDILRCISDLKLLGIRIWLDDFGTGFAGLSWLRLIDFDTVKIDRSFLHDSAVPRGKAMLKDIIGLVRNRGHKILVEGVESDDQMQLMREFGIDQVQGFHIGRPKSAENYQKPVPTKRPVAVLKSA
jgi:diguanylate cyclase (GGDEF)-like protein